MIPARAGHTEKAGGRFTAKEGAVAAKASPSTLVMQCFGPLRLVSSLPSTASRSCLGPRSKLLRFMPGSLGSRRAAFPLARLRWRRGLPRRRSRQRRSGPVVRPVAAEARCQSPHQRKKIPAMIVHVNVAAVTHPGAGNPGAPPKTKNHSKIKIINSIIIQITLKMYLLSFWSFGY